MFNQQYGQQDFNHFNNYLFEVHLSIPLNYTKTPWIKASFQ